MNSNKNNMNTMMNKVIDYMYNNFVSFDTKIQSTKSPMDTLPKVISNIIFDYKYQLELEEKYKKVRKELKKVMKNRNVEYTRTVEYNSLYRQIGEEGEIRTSYNSIDGNMYSEYTKKPRRRYRNEPPMERMEELSYRDNNYCGHIIESMCEFTYYTKRYSIHKHKYTKPYKKYYRRETNTYKNYYYWGTKTTEYL